MHDIRGFFIRKERLKKGYSLEALAHDICSISYLSKLEHSQVKASDEIYELLFHKLDITYLNDNEVSNIKKKLDNFFHSYFTYQYGCDQLCNELLLYEDEVKYSQLSLYYQIFKLYAQEMVSKKVEVDVDLNHYIQYMNQQEKKLYHLYKALFLGEYKNIFEDDTLDIFIWKAKAMILCNEKQYLFAYDLLQRAYQVVSQSGDIIGMQDILLSLGYVCSYIDLFAMSKFYHSAIKLSNHHNVQAMSYYNMGCIFLIHQEYSKAITYLKKGFIFCENTQLKKAYYEKLFIYYAIQKNEQKKHEYFEKVMDSSYYQLYSIMNIYLDYDQKIEYINLIKKLKGENKMLKHLFIQNCIKLKRYKDLYLEGEFVKKCNVAGE